MTTKKNYSSRTQVSLAALPSQPNSSSLLSTSFLLGNGGARSLVRTRLYGHFPVNQGIYRENSQKLDN